jgi:hypothetical protein
MLAALEQGAKGGKWYSLIDKLYPENTLGRAFAQVAANRGAARVDHVSVAQRVFLYVGGKPSNTIKNDSSVISFRGSDGISSTITSI